MVLIGFNFSFPFLPLFIQALGVTDRSELALWSGLTVGAGGIAMALFSPVWGMLADRFGRKAMLVRSIASGAILLSLQAAVTNVMQLIAARTLQGAFTGTQTAGAMLLAGIVPVSRTGFALGVLNTAIQVGNLIGPVLGGIVVVAIGLRGSFLVGAALLAICTAVIVALVEEAPVQVRPTGGVRASARDVLAPFAWPSLRGVLVVGAVVQVVYSSTVALLAIYVQDLAKPPWLSSELAIGLALALGALAAAVGMPILGTWADRHDARVLLTGSVAVFAAALVPQALIPNALVFLFLRLVVGLALAGTTSAIAVLTRAGAPAGAEGRAFGTLAAAQNLGWGIGPIVGSAFAAAAGIPALYLVGAGVIAAALVTSRSPRNWSVPHLDPREAPPVQVTEPT